MLTIKTGEYIDDGTKLDAYQFPYTPDSFQQHGFNSIEKGHDVVVTAHTGSGKTSVAIYAIMKHVAANKRVLYANPIKALSNQIFKDLRNMKGPDGAALDVGIKTGDISINEEAQVLVLTTEIVRNGLLTDQEESKERTGVFYQVGCVVFDEVHWIKDRDRGHVWEEAIISMPKEIQMVMLSATIPDADKFCEWVVKTTKHNVDLIPTSHRIVPLTHYIMGQQQLYPIMDNHKRLDNDQLAAGRKDFSFNHRHDLNEYVARLDREQMLPAFFFCFSRAKCEEYSSAVTHSLVDSKTSAQIGKLFDRKITKFGDRYRSMEQTYQVRNLLVKGVGFHHSGLIHVLKEIIEVIFNEGLLKVLFVTETFAAGVNMPARTVVFTSLQKFNGGIRNIDGSVFRDLLPEEYSQMAGRAGRRGKDPVGNVILLPFHRSEHNFERQRLVRVMQREQANIQSQFKLDYSLVLKLIFSNNSIETRRSLVDFSNQSMLNLQLANIVSADEHRVTQQKNQINELELELADYFTKEQGLGQRYLVTISNDFKQKKRKGKKGKKSTTKSATTELLTELNRVDTDLLHQRLQQRQRLLDLNEELAVLEEHLFNQKNMVQEQIYLVLSYLYQTGFLHRLHTVEEEDFIYSREDLTVKGLIAAQINECNPLVFTELICSDLLDNLTTSEIMAVLASFIEERSSEREPIWSYGVELAIKQLRYSAHNLAITESKLGLSPLNTDWELHKEMVDLAYTWTSQGTHIGNIYELNGDIYEGNFAKAMLKLKSLAESAIKAAEILGKDDLIKRLERYEELIIRSIVSPESLYVVEGA